MKEAWQSIVLHLCASQVLCKYSHSVMLPAGQVRWSADVAWDSRAVQDGRRASAEDVSVASLSKQLVHAKMSEASMQRKLRVGANVSA